jgi:hypothetical protein
MNVNAIPELEPQVEVGAVISCPRCLGRHALIPGPNNGALLLFYECGKHLHLGAVAGKLVVSI